MLISSNYKSLAYWFDEIVQSNKLSYKITKLYKAINDKNFDTKLWQSCLNKIVCVLILSYKIWLW